MVCLERGHLTEILHSLRPNNLKFVDLFLGAWIYVPDYLGSIRVNVAQGFFAHDGSLPQTILLLNLAGFET